MKKGISYFGVRNPKWVRRDMQEIRDNGFTHVLHTWSEEDSLYYPDTMAQIIDETTKLGLKVYVNPWGIGRVFGGEAYSELVGRNFTMAQISQDGSHRIAACPNHPEFRTYLHHWIDTVCKTNVETIFWDEPHFYFEKGHLNNWACRCDTCKNGFKKSFGYEMPSKLTPDVLKFREDSLINFLTEMTEHVHSLGKRNTVCMLPPWFPAGLDDWSRIAKLPSVDELASDPYWEKTTPQVDVLKNYTDVSKRLMNLSQKYAKEAQIWIKNYQIVRGRESDIEVATKASLDAGIQNIFAWSFHGSEYLSWLKSDQPKVVWETQIKAMRRQ